MSKIQLKFHGMRLSVIILVTVVCGATAIGIVMWTASGFQTPGYLPNSLGHTVLQQASSGSCYYFKTGCPLPTPMPESYYESGQYLEANQPRSNK